MSKYVYIVSLVKVDNRKPHNSYTTIIGIYDSESLAKEAYYTNRKIAERMKSDDEFTYTYPSLEEVKLNNTNTINKHHEW